MNVFWLDDDPETSARMHCDKHVPKMTVEYAQVLSTAAHLRGFHDEDRMYEPIPNNNKKLHEWAAESAENYLKLLMMAKYLGEEYEYRYGRQHKSMRDVISCIDVSDVKIDYNGFTEPPLSMPDYCVTGRGYIESYRYYYTHGKEWAMNWTNREVPDWYYGEVQGIDPKDITDEVEG